MAVDVTSVTGCGLDLHQTVGSLAGRGRVNLWRSPEIQVRNLMDARHRARRRTGLLRQEFPPNILCRVFVKGFAGPAALLRTIMDQPVFADVEIPGAGAATPIIGLALGDVFLKAI